MIHLMNINFYGTAYFSHTQRLYPAMNLFMLMVLAPENLITKYKSCLYSYNTNIKCPLIS